MTPSDQAFQELLELGFEHVCARPLDAFVDVEHVMRAIDGGLTEDGVSTFVRRFVAPVRKRLLERAQRSTVVLGAWLPEPTREALAQLLGQPVRLPRAMIDELVASPHTRDAVKAMLQDAIGNIVAKSFGGGARGMRGAIGMAQRAGKGLFGGIGEEVQRQLEERLRDFVDIGVGLVLQRIAHQLASDETAVLLGTRRKKAFLALAKKTEPDAARFLDSLQLPLLEALLPTVVVWNLRRAEVREALRAEVEATLRELGRQPVGELLRDLGLYDAVRDDVRAHGVALLRELWGTPAMQAWLDRHVHKRS